MTQQRLALVGAWICIALTLWWSIRRPAVAGVPFLFLYAIAQERIGKPRAGWPASIRVVYYGALLGMLTSDGSALLASLSDVAVVAARVGGLLLVVGFAFYAVLYDLHLLSFHGSKTA